jgi:hypothetical protein
MRSTGTGTSDEVQEYLDGELPVDIDCNGIGEIASGIIGNLYLSDTVFEDEGSLMCIWNGVQNAGMSEGSDLDMIITVQVPLSAEAEGYIETFCEQYKYQESAVLNDLGGGCIIDESDEGISLGARLQEWDVAVSVSCEMSTVCKPTLPANISYESIISALEDLTVEVVKNS